MVFEKILATVLNQFLGDYVENIDSSQLNCGIFAGDVTLRDLKVQENALENLDMPYRIVSGYIGELTLKIPWKNLYKSPTVALVDSVHILITPTLDVAYNAKREEEAFLAAKKKELERIEEAKRLSEQKADPQEAHQDTFVEKLTANIIKNLQVKISDIHIRYEDRITNPQKPFAVGFTLHKLSLDTADSSWRVCVIRDDTVKIIHKLVVLDSLAVYWNITDELFSTRESGAIKELMKREIATASRRPSGISYILGPINSEAKLCLNLRPETDKPSFSIPSVVLDIVIEEIALGISKYQYQCLMELLDSFDRMVIASVYRKYRPSVPCKGNPQQWWKFCFTAILEEEVKRRKRNWSWAHMHGHRKCCRDYRELYQEKLLNPKLPKDKIQKLEMLERTLDVFNITVVRKQAELKVASELKRRSEAASSSGWLSGWIWGSRPSQTPADDNIMSQIAAAINTPEEKAKLYEAIGYQDNAIPVEYPIEYVKTCIRLKLRNLSLTISDASRTMAEVMNFQLREVAVAFEQRPSAQAIWSEISVDEMFILGSPMAVNGKSPRMVYSHCWGHEDRSSQCLLHILYETNPLDKSCDQRVVIKTQPLEIVYDAATIINLVEVLKPPESVALQQLQAVAMMKIKDMKELSAYGLQYAIEQHKFLSVHLDFQPLILLIPERGDYESTGHTLILTTGNLKITSVPREADEANVSRLVKAGSTEVDVLSSMMSQAYDKFQITLDNVEALLTMPGEDWRELIGKSENTHHLICPINMNVLLQKCIIPDDPRMPKLKVCGDLPLLNLCVSDSNLFILTNLLTNLPLPASDSPPPPSSEFATQDLASVQNAQARNQALKLATQSDALATEVAQEGGMKKRDSSSSVQYTELDLKFEMKQMCLDLFHVVDGSNKHLLQFSIHRLGTSVAMRTFDMSVDLYLGGMTFETLEYKSLEGGPLYLLHTPRTDQSGENLFTFHYLNANKSGPDFQSLYESTLQNMVLDVSEMEVVLHQDAILSAMNFINKITSSLMKEEPTPAVPEKKVELAVVETKKAEVSKEEPKRGKRKPEEHIIDMKVVARMSSIGVSVATKDRAVSLIALKGLEASVVMDKEKTAVQARWKDVLVLDPAPNAVHPKIISCLSDDVLSVGLELFNESTSGEKYTDISAVDMKLSASLGRMRIVYLNKYISSLMDFLNQFQAAKEKLAEAGTAAAMQAKQSVEQAYASRISLNIKLSAPLIIIPQNSKSVHALVADFGTLQVHNKFQLCSEMSHAGIPAMSETIVLELVELKMLRVKLDKDTGHMKEMCMLLEPISFILKIDRNLSSSWCKDVPEMAVEGTLRTVQFSFSQGDIGAVLKMLNENLSEVDPSVSPPAITVAGDAGKQAEASMETRAISGGSTSDDKSTVVEATQVQDKTYKAMTLVFQLDSIILTFYRGESQLESTLRKRSPRNAYVRMELRTIAVKGEILTDQTTWYNVILGNFCLDDMRSWRKGGIIRLFERSICEQHSGLGGMIDVTFVQCANGDKIIHTKISSFNLVMSLEYLMDLGDYFSKAMATETSSEQAVAAQPARTEAQTAATTPATNSTTHNLPLMTIELKVDQPAIVLIEDFENINSNAVILNNEISLKMKSNENTQVIYGTISKLELFTACFNPELREDTKAQILSPCELVLHSNAKKGSGQNVDINLSEIVLQVTPASVQIISNILMSSGTEKPENTSDKEIQITDYSNIWKPRWLKDCNFWFLNTVKIAEEATETLDVATPVADPPELPEQELLLFSVEKIVLTIEAGVGNRTVPLILLEASFQAQVKNWSSELNIASALGLEMAYYNEKLAVWEPLIEPVETASGHRPWEIKCQVVKNPEDFPDFPDEESTPNEIVLQPPVMSIYINSDDALNMVMSKTALEVVYSLSEAFREAVAQAKGKKSDEPAAAYIVKNFLGIPIVIILTDGAFTVLGYEKSSDIVEACLEEGTIIALNMAEQKLQKTTSVLNQIDGKVDTDIILRIQNEVFDSIHRIPVSRAEKRFFQLPHKTYPGDQWGLICDVISNCGQKIILFHSPVKIFNHFSVPIAVYYMKRGEEEILECCGIAEPNKVFYVPLQAVYTYNNELFFKPEIKDYAVCTEPFVWKDLVNEPYLSYVLQCHAKEPEKEVFYIKAVAEMEHIYYEGTNRKTFVSACYKLQLRPTVIFRNLIPHPIKYSLEGEDKESDLDEGCSAELWTMDLGKTQMQLKIMEYMDQHWCCEKTPDANMDELTVWSFEAVTSDTLLILDLGMHASWQEGTLVLVLYCPFWMINKTDYTLAYKTDDANVVVHPPDTNIPVLFSFKAKNFFSKKKIAVKVNDSEWSDKFSIDVVGSSGTVLAKTKSDKSYMLGVEIKLSQSGLTKIIVYTPYYLVVNSSQFIMEYRENIPNASWILVPAKKCIPFWPSQTKVTQLVVRFAGTFQVSEPFSFSKQHTTLLKLKNSKGGIEVDCQITDSSTILTLSEYSEGKASVLIANHTEKYTVTYCQKGKKEKQCLACQQAIYYTWEDPLSKRELLWTCASSKEQSNNLLQDGIGEIKVADDAIVYWVSFLDNMQRVLLITEDLALATAAQQAGELERVEREVLLSLHSFGLTLINNYDRAEIMHAAITSSGIIWEGCKNRQSRYKPLKIKECQAMEKYYQKYEKELHVNKSPKSRHIIEGKYDVDFAVKPLPKLYKPYKGYLRRTFQPGLWFQLKTSPHNMALHLKLNRLQVDNQLQDCVFPVILAPVPIPKSVAADNAPKPFAEVSIVQRITEYSTMSQYKNFQVLIQEFHLKIDQTFLTAIFAFLATEEPAEVDHVKLMKTDKKVLDHDLMALAAAYSSQEQKNFYDLLHFSPLKIHISFSNLGGSSSDQGSSAVHLKFVGLLLRSVGVSVTEIQDVILRLNYFERKNMFLTHRLLMSEATSHYTSQFLKQIYVVVLGLDVIGNPVGLLLGLSEGVESFFYEPFQGAIQGPEEFVEGVALGVKSLFSHAIGGTAGAVSRITGTLGKGVAALTLDDDYQKKRRQNLNRQPQTLTHGLAQSGRGLVMGVFEGVTGVITKPVEGARQEGVQGFAKGVGKGLIGFVARPVSGAVDFASGSLDAVKRAVDVTEEVRRLRPPRIIKSDGIIRPYVLKDAEGNKLLQDVEKGKYASTDEYITHSTIMNLEGRSFFMITTKRVMFISKGDVFGQWDLEWQYTYDEIKGVPTVVDTGLKIMLKETGKKKFGLFGSTEKGKIVNIGNEEMCRFLAKKIAEQLKG